jgi:nucleobindin
VSCPISSLCQEEALADAPPAPPRRDGILDQNELESIYGVHHEKRRKASGDSVEVHTQKAKEIVKEVLDKLDTNGDGVLTMREFVAGGVGGLPNFKGVEHLGHHYG